MSSVFFLGLWKCSLHFWTCSYLAAYFLFITDWEQYLTAEPTVIIYIVKRSSAKVLQVVLREGADPNLPGCPVSPLWIAITHKYVEADVMKVLLNYGATRNVRYRCQVFDQEKIQCLIHAGERHIAHLCNHEKDKNKELVS